ncbi:MAG: hypothetical protein J6U54_24995, partial [Clostridiales bacterium]|nr:hypothetical protein [Clostridiales bacterium]
LQNFSGGKNRQIVPVFSMQKDGANMAKVVTIVDGTSAKKKRRAPDVSDQQREKRICDLALTAVEERIRNGTATSAELVHFLKLASERNRYEIEELHSRVNLQKAKVDAINEAKKQAVDYEEVKQALTHYGSTIIASSETDYSDII